MQRARAGRTAARRPRGEPPRGSGSVHEGGQELGLSLVLGIGRVRTIPADHEAEVEVLLGVKHDRQEELQCLWT